MKIHNLKSNAKININLNIISKSPSRKIHFIESLVVFIKLSDLINIQETNSKSHKIMFKGKFSKGISFIKKTLATNKNEKKLPKSKFNSAFLFTLFIK